MSLSGKLEADVELKSSGDEWYKIFSAQVHQMPTASTKIKSVDLHDGHWEHPGAIKQWTYVIDGRTETFKERVHFDEKDKIIFIEGLEGDLLQRYKKFTENFQVMDKGKCGLVKLTIEYEKINEDDEPPQQYLDYVVSLIKDIDDHLINTA